MLTLASSLFGLPRSSSVLSGSRAGTPVWIALALLAGCGPSGPPGPTDPADSAGPAGDTAPASPPREAATPESPPSHLLSDYLARADASYEWHEHARFTRGGAEIVALRLVSQTWRGTLWKHQLFLIYPPELTDPQHALLVIGGGRWTDELERETPTRELPDGAEVFVGLARATGSVVAVLGTVPFQPLLGLTEDRLIAHTFDRFLAEGDSDWPLLFPMVKASVSAMDAAQAAAAEIWDLPIESFTVTGGSKRGWTAWLTAASDPRVTAVVPIVIDALNMAEHFPYQTEVWGAPSPEIRPYTELRLDEILASDGGRALREAVDPYAYRSVLTMPKLIVNASNDAYFPLDSVNLYWAGLPEPKRLLYVPNEGHSIDAIGRVLPTIIALHEAGRDGTDLPTVSWQHEIGDVGYRLCVTSMPPPERVVIWRAESADRDFRDETWTAAAESRSRSAEPFVWEHARQDEGYAAVFAELWFRTEFPYALTTGPAVIPARGSQALGEGPVDQGQACPEG